MLARSECHSQQRHLERKDFWVCRMQVKDLGCSPTAKLATGGLGTYYPPFPVLGLASDGGQMLGG